MQPGALPLPAPVLQELHALWPKAEPDGRRRLLGEPKVATKGEGVCLKTGEPPKMGVASKRLGVVHHRPMLFLLVSLTSKEGSRNKTKRETPESAPETEESKPILDLCCRTLVQEVALLVCWLERQLRRILHFVRCPCGLSHATHVC